MKLVSIMPSDMIPCFGEPRIVGTRVEALPTLTAASRGALSKREAETRLFGVSCPNPANERAHALNVKRMRNRRAARRLGS